jgi:hypothetical protein
VQCGGGGGRKRGREAACCMEAGHETGHAPLWPRDHALASHTERSRSTCLPTPDVVETGLSVAEAGTATGSGGGLFFAGKELGGRRGGRSRGRGKEDSTPTRSDRGDGGRLAGNMGRGDDMGPSEARAGLGHLLSLQRQSHTLQMLDSVVTAPIVTVIAHRAPAHQATQPRLLNPKLSL